MKTIFASIAVLLLLTVQSDAWGRGGHSSGSGHSPSYKSSYNHGGHHYRGYSRGDGVPSGYIGRSPGLQNIDQRHERQPPGANITGNSFYRGVDRHGALMFGN